MNKQCKRSYTRQPYTNNWCRAIEAQLNGERVGLCSAHDYLWSTLQNEVYNKLSKDIKV